jgi:hypothetical protein
LSEIKGTTLKSRPRASAIGQGNRRLATLCHLSSPVDAGIAEGGLRIEGNSRRFTTKRAKRREMKGREKMDLKILKANKVPRAHL